MTILRAHVKNSSRLRVLLAYRSDRGLKSRHFFGGEGRSTRKGKISAQINTWRVVDFSFDTFLVQSIVSWKVPDILHT